MLAHRISQAKAILHHGGVIAYSTETVLGLGCDPYNQNAVNRIVWLKNRAVESGLIVLVDSIETLQKYTKALTEKQITAINKAELTSWLLPANDRVPSWIMGAHDKVAVRITDHPTASPLSNAADGIVSTSANISCYKTLTSQSEVRDWFGPHIDYILINRFGSGIPSKICDLLTGEELR